MRRLGDRDMKLLQQPARLVDSQDNGQDGSYNEDQRHKGQDDESADANVSELFWDVFELYQHVSPMTR